MTSQGYVLQVLGDKNALKEEGIVMTQGTIKEQYGNRLIIVRRYFSNWLGAYG